MLDFFKKKLRKNAQVAVCSNEQTIAVARVRHNKDEPPLLELCAMQEIENTSVRDAELARLIKQHELDEYPCLTSLDLGDYNLMLVEAPDVQPEEMNQAIKWKIRDMIDFDVNDAVVDVFEAPVNKSMKKERMLYAVVARASQVKHLIDYLNNADLNLDIVDIPELALRNVAAMLPEDVGGVALVYIGQNQGLITITRQGELYLSRSIHSGVSALPEMILSVMDDDDCLRWADSIVIEVQRSMDYYDSHFSQPQLSSLVLAPFGKEIPGLTEYLSEQLQLPVRILDVNEIIDTEETVSAEVQSRCLLAIGTALRNQVAA